ncbi:HET domain-containing protein [endosymbiont GvMRE of Glomus versiforme]|uniref:HET domain-containing protein n=1 Tax=endosymbiont GvMRE of Glomus versiforme TaxID=2039283 RepID=UPI000EE17A9F|nr:HET domain-containing protein [endosymbiont GvMRE of Glomus versiforme]RHZ36473.1 HET domain protein [endosymbiont GvMRE of Glomus versiforme]
MVNAQEWLDKNYPKEGRKNVSKMVARNLNLEGGLDLSDFVNLEILDCLHNKLTSLNISKCPKLFYLQCGMNQITSLSTTNLTNLTEFHCSDNYLTELDFSPLSIDRLTGLNISDNNLSQQDLSVFSRFVNLNQLWVGGIDEKKLKNGVYNRFIGSLKPLKKLISLQSLEIANTDIDSGLEHLPISVRDIWCSSKEKPSSRVKKIEHLIKESGNFVFSSDDQAYVKKSEAQKWLDKNYPKEKRWSVEYIDLSNQKLVGDLDLTDFSNLKGINIYGNPQLGKIVNKPHIFVRINAQDWLNWKYPNKQAVKKIVSEDWEAIQGELIIDDFPRLEVIELGKDYLKNQGALTQLKVSNCPHLKKIKCSYNWTSLAHLELINCPNLEEIICQNNRLKELDVRAFPKLKILNCYQNFLTNLDLSQNIKLKALDISHNNFAEQDLSFINHLVNLKTLRLGSKFNKERINQSIYNRFYGSLEHLKNMSELEELDIDNTDLNEGVEHLPDNLSKKISCSTEYRPESRVKEIKWQLDLFTNKMQRKWKDLDFSFEEIKSWIEAGLGDNDYDFAHYLKNNKKIEPQDIKNNLIELRSEYDNSQERKAANENFSANEAEKIEIGDWKNIHPDFSTYLNLGFFGVKKNKDYQEDWENLGFNYQQTKGWIDKGLEPAHSRFVFYLKVKGYQSSQLLTSDLAKLWQEYLNPQAWLNFWYPVEKRKISTKLDLKNESLKGDLTLDDWDNLVELDCFRNNFSNVTLSNLPELKILSIQDCEADHLTIINCPNLQKIDVSYNSLTDLNFINNLNPEKLTSLAIGDNLFPERDLSCFSRFKKLEELKLGNAKVFKLSSEKQSTNYFNHFYGSLKPLQNLNKLTYLDISDTDIDSGLEYLPDGLDIVSCSAWEDQKNRKIKEELKDYYLTNKLVNDYNPQAWKKNQSVFKSIVENLSKTNPNLDLQEFLHQQNIFLNVATGTFQGNLQGLASLLQIDESLFEKKEREIILLELRIKELTSLIQKKREKIFNAYLNFLSEGEKDKLNKLIIIYLQFIKAKQQSLLSSELKRQYQEVIKQQLSQNQSQELIKEVQQILNNCKQLVDLELELKEKLSNKALIQEKNHPFLLTDNSQEEKKESLRLVPNTPLQLLGKESKFTENYNIEEINYNKIYLETSSSWKNKLPTTEELPTKLYNVKTGQVEETEGRNDIKDYAILSYVWGDPTMKATPEMENRPWWKKQLATVWSNKNLNKAIKTCKLLNIDYLWMDQLCINQNNIEEKRREVRKMRGYYNNASVTLVAINTNTETIEEENEEKQFDSLNLLKKIVDSQWFTRSWTYQEGWLSKHTIFMFDDKLIDGKAIAGIWSLDQPTYNSHEKDRIFEGLLEGSLKIATPVGWVYHQEGYTPEDKVSLRLHEILRSTKNRGRAVAIDSIYSILGLLPYGSKVIPKYKEKLCKYCKKKESEWRKAIVCEHHEEQKTQFPTYFKEELDDALLDVMKVAVEHGHGEPLSWHGESNSWLPTVNTSNGSIEIEGGINVDCKEKSVEFFSGDNSSIKISGSEYIVFSSRDDDDCPISTDEKSTVDSGLHKRKFSVLTPEGNKKKIILWGVYKSLDVTKNDYFLIVPNKKEWKSNKLFAILATKEGDIYHRIGLVELDQESVKILQGAPEKKVIIGEANSIIKEKGKIESKMQQEQNSQQQFQAQIRQK